MLNMLRGHSFEHYFKDHNVLVSIIIRKDRCRSFIYVMTGKMDRLKVVGIKKEKHINKEMQWA